MCSSDLWQDGDILYLSPTISGGLTNVKPSSPNHLVVIGCVIHAHSQHGKIFVKVDSSWEIEELHDVQVTGTPAAGSLLIYDASSGTWKNATLTAGAGITITNSNGAITISLS